MNRLAVPAAVWLAALAGCGGPAESRDAGADYERLEEASSDQGCEDKYGEAQGFSLCSSDADKCRFSAQLPAGHSCSDVCASGGGECIEAFGNASNNVCGALSEISCDTVGHVDDICVCSNSEPEEPEGISCEERYGVSGGFELCGQAEEECTFSAQLAPGQSCADVCADGGGECLEAFGNASNNVCGQLGEIDCATVGHFDDVCVCSNPGWSPPPPPPPSDPAPPDGDFDGSQTPESLGLSLLFSSRFEQGTSVPAPYVQGNQWWQDILGEDETTGFDWADLPGDPRFQFMVGNGKSIQNYATNRIETVTGPFGEPTRALYMEQRLDDPDYAFNARNQLVWGNHDGIGEDTYYSYWVKLQDDLNELPDKCNSSASWRLMGEWFTATDRIGYEIRDVGGDPHWFLKHQRKTDSGWSNDLFAKANHDVEVPVGEWFFFEVYMKHSSSSDGRVLIKVDGETVFDQRGRNRTGGTVTSFFVPKLYDGYRDSCRRFQWIDDFQIWR